MTVIQSQQLDVRVKVWLVLDGEPVIGEGRLNMLKSIDRNGSMLYASQETGISYRKLRGAIREMEKVVGGSLVTAIRGGDNGGGTTLTAAAHDLIDSYEERIKLYQPEGNKDVL